MMKSARSSKFMVWCTAAYEGEELQLPGYFLLDREMNVLEAHRAKTMMDMPTIDEMIAKL